MSTPAINQRFAAYAASNGQTPAVQLASDKKRWPGGKMTGFLIWNSERLKAFRAVSPEAFRHLGGDTFALQDHAAYDAWLAEQVSAEAHATRRERETSLLINAGIGTEEAARIAGEVG